MSTEALEEALRDLHEHGALQDSSDWLGAASAAVADALGAAGPDTAVCGVGVDFTSCTALPVAGPEATPLHHSGRKTASSLPPRRAPPRRSLLKWTCRHTSPQTRELPALLRVIADVLQVLAALAEDDGAPGGGDATPVAPVAPAAEEGEAQRRDAEGLRRANTDARLELTATRQAVREMQAQEAEARRRVELLSDRLLANPVIENWTLELSPS